MPPVILPSDLNKMTTANMIALLSHIVYEQAVRFEFPDGDIETMRKLVDALEYRLVILPELEVSTDK